MPFDQWYDDATREAATARVLQRRMTNPGDRNTLTVVADEFDIPQQTLAAWVEEASPDSPTPPKKPRPKFSQVVRTSKPAPEPAPEPEPEPVEEPEEPEAAVAEPTEDAPEAGGATSEDAAPEAAEAPVEPEASDDGALPEATSEPDADDELAADAGHDDSPESDAAPEPLAETPPAPPAPTGRVAALEAEAASLRADKAALIAAIRILLER